MSVTTNCKVVKRVRKWVEDSAVLFSCMHEAVEGGEERKKEDAILQARWKMEYGGIAEIRGRRRRRRESLIGGKVRGRGNGYGEEREREVGEGWNGGKDRRKRGERGRIKGVFME